MAIFLNLPPEETETVETERFAVQKCPRCAGFTAVPLCLAETSCVICAERIEVAPLLA